jgi:hypothetical protein
MTLALREGAAVVLIREVPFFTYVCKHITTRYLYAVGLAIMIHPYVWGAKRSHRQCTFWYIFAGFASAVACAYLQHNLPSSLVSYKKPAIANVVYSRLLDVSSMWALGANARTVPPRRRSVPLVTWSPDAVSMVADTWRAAQRPTSCNRALFVYPSYWGITSQMRDFGDVALVSLAFQRPLRHIRHARQPIWCPANTWLGCFFDGFDSTGCDGGLPNATAFHPETSTPASRRATFKQLRSQHVLVAKYLSDFSFVLDDELFFPTKLWERLLDAAIVQITDSKTGLAIDSGTLKRRQPSMYHTLAISTLRTILIPAVFPPREDIRRAASHKINLFRIRDARPCLSLHLRWTDKQADGGVAAKMQHNVDFIIPALDRIAQITRRSYSCLVLLSDDDLHALPVLKTALRSRGIKIFVLTRLSSFFERADQYKMYARIGHSYLSSHLCTDKAFEYFRHVVIDIVCAALTSDVLIGVGSSGVSQLVAQYMGYAHGVEANAVALWQEDVLRIS